MYFTNEFHAVCPFIVLHCRCHKCSSVPARKRVRKQVSSLGLLSLPEEVLLCVLQYLSAEDLLAVRAVSRLSTSICIFSVHQGSDLRA